MQHIKVETLTRRVVVADRVRTLHTQDSACGASGSIAANLSRGLPDNLGKMAIGAEAGRGWVGHAEKVGIGGKFATVPLSGNSTGNGISVAATVRGRAVASEVLSVTAGTLVPIGVVRITGQAISGMVWVLTCHVRKRSLQRCSWRTERARPTTSNRERSGFYGEGCVGREQPVGSCQTLGPFRYRRWKAE